MEGKEERKKWDIHKIHNKMVGKMQIYKKQ